MSNTGCVAHLSALLVILGPATCVRGLEVQGILGQSVTLLCTYSVQKHGKTEMCWGRGQCPSSGCSGPLLRTNGTTVISPILTKYHMDGKIEEGDVSLTVNHLQKGDSGWYCCRVQISGLFNDQKVSINLVVSESSSTPPPSSTTFYTTDCGNCLTSNTIESITGNLNSAFTTSPAETSNLVKNIDKSSSNAHLQVWTGVGLGIFIFLTGIAIFIFKKKLKVFQKDDSAKSAIGIHMHHAAEENVYNVE
ncbi:hepatitis A virus cellular receptor 1 homolog [Chiloscyllium plagiosum]|uniref:hepatitis A virus cellular receptor 1 homolog n=1 Tax=Chiloscyllium plagiosum TaxID=36176 RepID=UPI001CB80EF6|nr:hepatitis A virus cellular receptor 1 homolog [Chiloscyllium plagiosum]XP_043559955.1 hepatitis A virus cellular receptor 1 homolog [Chiloscyllium plagiosum]